MGRSVIVTPLYISVAWTLLVSYQLFTQVAVVTMLTYLEMFLPSVGVWLTSRIDMIVFIHAFAWIFVLSSVIPSVILGKERSVLAQFFVCLALTIVAFVVQDMLATSGEPIYQLSSLVALFHNPFIALGYLLMPYLFMFILDIRSRRRQKKIKEMLGDNFSLRS